MQAEWAEFIVKDQLLRWAAPRAHVTSTIQVTHELVVLPGIGKANSAFARKATSLSDTVWL